MVRRARRCPSLQQLAGYLDGTLGSAGTLQTYVHVRVCRACRELLQNAVPALAWSRVADLRGFGPPECRREGAKPDAAPPFHSSARRFPVQ